MKSRSFHAGLFFLFGYLYLTTFTSETIMVLFGRVFLLFGLLLMADHFNQGKILRVIMNG